MCPGAWAASATLSPSNDVSPDRPFSMCHANRTVHSPWLGALRNTHGQATSQLPPRSSSPSDSSSPPCCARLLSGYKGFFGRPKSFSRHWRRRVEEGAEAQERLANAEPLGRIVLTVS